MSTAFTPNLDKLRNIVQRFGPHSFTAAQVALEYDADAPLSAQTVDELLQRHAAVLGIQSVAGNPGVWVAH